MLRRIYVKIRVFYFVCRCVGGALSAGPNEEAKAADAREDYTTELTIVSPLAEKGEAWAQNILGGMYYYGLGVPQNDTIAMSWFRKAANQGDPEAQLNLGEMYETDFSTAMNWYRKAADQGNTRAEILLGDIYKYGRGVSRDFAQAVAWYRKAADQGDIEAQINLGEMSEYGQGVPQNYVQAVVWYRKAADQGNAEAQIDLGDMYNYGRGMPKDYAQAMAWYRKAADQGDAKAQFNLGVMFDAGEGVQQDYAQAYMWYTLAATNEGVGPLGDAAMAFRVRVEEKMTPAEIARAQRMASKWEPATTNGQ
jgi:uncharacterized protein